jgi:hypothetical protein
MSVSFLAVGTGASSTSTTVSGCSPGMPSGWAAGDLLLLYVGWKQTGAALTTPSGWTSLISGQASANGAAYGAAAGDTKISVFYRVAQTGDTAPTIADLTGGSTVAGSGNVMAAQIMGLHNATGVWSVAAVGGSQDTNSTAWSIPFGSDPGITSGDFLATLMAKTTTAGSPSAAAVTATGAVIGAGNNITSIQSTIGADVATQAIRYSVTSGTAIANPTFTVTQSSNNYGAVALVRVRESTGSAYSGSGALSGTGTVSGAGTPAFDQPGALSGSGAVSGTGTPALIQSGALGGSGSLTGAGTPALTTTGALGGSGTVSASGTPGPIADGSLSGSGSVAATGTPAVSLAGALGGTGSLAATGSPATGDAGGLSGDGTVSSTGTPALVQTGSLNGAGTVSATGTPDLTQTGALSGDGTITGTGTPSTTGSGGTSGTGTLSGAGTPAVTQTGALSGTGTVTAGSGLSTYAEGALVGAGLVTAPGSLPGLIAAGQLYGTGTLTGLGFAGAARVVRDVEISNVRIIGYVCTITPRRYQATIKSTHKATIVGGAR